jgi:hypothetical protein
VLQGCQSELKLSGMGQGKLKLSIDGNECKPCPHCAQLGALLAPRAKRVDVRLHRLGIRNSRGRGRGDEGERAGLADGLGAPKPGGGEGDARTETLHGT